MLRTVIFAAAAALSIAHTGAHAQTATPGYQTTTQAPAVSLPRVTNNNVAGDAQATEQAPYAKPLPKTTEIIKSGSSTTISNPTVVAAPKTNTTSGASQTRTSTGTNLTPVESKYRAGMTISGKARAVDGQELVVDGVALVLEGVDAPGLRQVCSAPMGTGWRCGQKAKDRLASLVGDGIVRCKVTRPAGTGAAAVCSASQSKDVGEILISEGLAVPNKKRGSYYRPAALRAANTGRGMWMGQFEAPATWRAKHR